MADGNVIVFEDLGSGAPVSLDTADVNSVAPIVAGPALSFGIPGVVIKSSSGGDLIVRGRWSIVLALIAAAQASFANAAAAGAAAIATFKALLVEHPGPSGPFSTSLPGDAALLVTRFMGNISAYIGYPVPGAQRLLTIDVISITASAITTATTVDLFKNGAQVVGVTGTMPALSAAGSGIRITLGAPLAFADGDKYDLRFQNTAGGAGNSLSVNIVFGWSPTTA